MDDTPWLQRLVNAKLGDAVGPQLPQTLPHPGTDQLRHQLITVRNGDLFVCPRPGLLLGCALGRLKKESMTGGGVAAEAALATLDSADTPPPAVAEASVFKRFQCVGLDFQPRQVCLAPSGKLLAVLGDRHVAVIILPSSAQLKGAKSPAMCTAYKVGEFHHATDTYRTVVSAMWHPRSPDGRHLCVLSSDSCLRVYAVADNVTDPVSTSYFCQENSTSAVSFARQGTFADAADAYEAVSFCFADSDAADLDNTSVTAFCVMRNGDIYSLAGLALNSRQTAKSAGPYAVMPRPADICGSSVEERASDIICTSIARDGVSIQLLIVAYEHGKLEIFLPDVRPDQAKQTAAGHFGLENESDEDEVGLNDDTAAIFEDELVLFETVDLGLFAGGTADDERDRLISSFLASGSNLVTLLTEPSQPGMLFACHSMGVHCIEFGAWAERLISLLITPTGDTAALLAGHFGFGSDTAENRHAWSRVSCLLAAPTTKIDIVGAAIVSDVYLDQTMILLTSSLELVARDLSSLRPRLVDTGEPESGEESAADTSLRNVMALQDDLKLDGAALTSLLRELPLENVLPFIERTSDNKFVVGSIVQQSGSFMQSPAQPSKRYPEFKITKDILSQYSQAASQYRADIKTLLEYSVALESRMQLFEAEWERVDAIMSQYVQPQTAKNQTESAELKRRLAAAESRQQRLAKRVDLVLQISIEAMSPDLSDAEKQWDQELQQLAAKGIVDLRNTVNQMQEQIAMLNREYEIDVSAAAGRVLASQPNQLRLISDNVSQEGQFIEGLRNKLQELEIKIQLLN